MILGIEGFIIHGAQNLLKTKQVCCNICSYMTALIRPSVPLLCAILALFIVNNF